MRAPFLSVSPAMLRDIGSWGYVVAGVSLDTKDYSFPRPNLLKNMADTVAPSMANANPDQISFIVLQHDFVSGGQEWLRSFVPDMQQRGFRFVTSEECLKVTAYR